MHRNAAELTGAAVSMIQRYVTTENGEIFTKITGRGDALLLIHGTASDANYFDDAVPLLAECFRVITYDRNGNSRSRPAEHADFTYAGEARDGWEILDSFGIKHAAIVGVSSGGHVALEMALARPEQISRLILYEPPFCVTEESERTMAAWNEKVARLAKDGNTAGVLLAFVDMIGGIDSDSPPVSTEQQVANFNNFCFFLKHQFKQFSSKLYFKEALFQISVPCCIMAGTEDRDGLFRQTAIDTARVLNVEPVFAPGYHNFPKDYPKLFAEMIREMMLDGR